MCTSTTVLDDAFSNMEIERAEEFGVHEIKKQHWSLTKNLKHIYRFTKPIQVEK